MRTLLLILAAFVVHAQSPNFEVASIKSAPPPDPHGTRVGVSGGPGTNEPGRWSAENMTLQDLILLANDIQPFQLSGPSWLNTERFNIQARVPEGATRPEFRQMLQNLLAERFRLAVHREQKGTSSYRLVVAKNGPKLTEAKPRDPSAPPPKLDGRLRTGKDGFPELPPGVPIMLSTRGMVLRQAVGESMDSLASMLGRQIGKPVTNATGLAGKYDFVLKWRGSGRGVSPMPSHGGDGAINPSGEDLGPDLFTALQEQLGLKLESGRGAVELLVVDRVEKTPVQN